MARTNTTKEAKQAAAITKALQAATRKELGYAYASSQDADTFGYPKGCWTVAVCGAPPEQAVPIKAFPTSWEAFQYAKALPLEWTFLQLTYGIHKEEAMLDRIEKERTDNVKAAHLFTVYDSDGEYMGGAKYPMLAVAMVQVFAYGASIRTMDGRSIIWTVGIDDKEGETLYSATDRFKVKALQLFG